MANLISKIKTPDNVTYDIQDNVSTFGNINLLSDKILNLAVASTTISANDSYRGMYCQVEGNQTYTISRKIIEGNRFWLCWAISEPIAGTTVTVFSNNNSLLETTVTSPETAKWLFIYLSNQGDTINGRNIKVEKGNKATDWTPALQDLVTYDGTDTIEFFQ